MLTVKPPIFDLAALVDDEISTGAFDARSLADAMPQIVWTANSDGNVDYYNQAWFVHTGFTLEQTQGNGWQAALHPDDLQNCIRLSRNAIRTGSLFQAEYRIWCASDNSFRWHLCRALPIKNDDSKIVRWIGTCTDIDSQKLDAEKSEALFRAAMDITADAICLLDRASMRFIDCNDTACRMFGYSREELLELGPSDIGAGTQDQLQTCYDEVIAGKTFSTSECLYLRKDGSQVPVEIQRQAMRPGKDWIMVLVARDITERKEAESRLQRLAYYDQLTGLPTGACFMNPCETPWYRPKSNR